MAFYRRCRTGRILDRLGSWSAQIRSQEKFMDRFKKNCAGVWFVMTQ
jgi:hypothetical protein